jgi:hypothetical protein
MIRKLQRQIAFDVFQRQELERQFREQPADLQIAANLQERMLRDGHLGRPVGAEQQHPHAVEACDQVVEQVDRGHVSPVEIVEEHHQRPEP